MVARRVEAIEPRCQDVDRPPARGQGGDVGGAVDAVGAAGDDDPLPVRQVCGELGGDVIAVPGRRTAATRVFIAPPADRRIVGPCRAGSLG